MTTAAAGLIEFSIREYGRLRGSLPATPATTIAAPESGSTTTACQYVGPEFNPLEETDKMGRPNPYQDKTRGRLTAYQLSTSSSGGTGNGAIINKNVLVNLSGPDSIIGRSIVAFVETGTAPSVLNDGWVESTALTGTEILAEAYGCCVIGIDSPPDLASQTHHHHGPGTVAHSHAGTQYQGHTHSGFSHGG